jgi:hypothetical protein
LKRWVVVLSLGVAACSNCGKPKSAAPTVPVERVLPAGARVYVLVPSVEKLGEKLLIVEQLKVANFAAQAAGLDNAHAYVDALVNQLAIDLRSKAQLDRIGILAEGQAGVAFVDEDNSALLALPIKDEGRIGAFIRTFAANRFGASVIEDKTENGVTVHRLMAAAGPKLAWASSNGYALIAPQKVIEHLAAWARASPTETLSSDAALPTSLKRLPTERDAIIYAPAGLDGALSVSLMHATIALSLTHEAFTMTADVPWVGDAAQLKLFEPSDAPASLLGYLPDDAFMVMRFAGDPQQLKEPVKPLLGPALQRAFTEGGFDFDSAVLQNLQPGAVVGLSLAPTAHMGQGVPELDIRRTNPFAYLHLSGAAKAKSADVVGSTLEKLAAVAPKFGAQMSLKDGVYVTTYSQGEGVHFAAKGDTVVFGSPLGRIGALVATDGTAAGPVRDPGLKAPLEASALGLVIDLRKLSDAVRELPASAWGVGGFAIKATTLRWLDNTDDLKAITATVGAKEGAVQAKVQLLLSIPGPAGDAGR